MITAQAKEIEMNNSINIMLLGGTEGTGILEITCTQALHYAKS